MSTDIVMPQLGLTMTEGAVTAWLKNPGDRVQKGEPLFSVETDKVEMEVESTAGGLLQSILVEPGKLVKVGTVIARVGDSMEHAGEPAAEQAGQQRGSAKESIEEAAPSSNTTDAASAAARSGRQRGEPLASPRARKIAKELGVDLAQVRSSRGNRIVEEDVRKYHAQHGAATTAPAQAGTTRQERSRAIIAERLSASFREAPHFYLGVEVNAIELVRLREKLLETVSQRAGVKLTYTDFFLMAMARALAENEQVNASWRDGRAVRNSGVNVGLAVQGTASLLVPVIRDANSLSLSDLAKKRSALVQGARDGKLSLGDSEGGGATLSNLGAYGIDWFQAVLNPPQSVIVAAGRIVKKPAVIGEQLTVCPMLTLTLSGDHRVLDGAGAAKFLTRVQELLENPYVFLL